MDNYRYRSWPASQAEIICASQKDDQYYHLYIEEPTQEVLKRILGNRRWIEARDSISCLSRLIYFTFTTLSGVKTLGEEYTNTLLTTTTNTGQIVMPTLVHRILTVSLHSFDSHIIRYASRLSSKLITDNKDHPIANLIINTLGSKVDSKLLDERFTLIYRAHLIAFFLFGTYYHLTKRLTSMEYVVNDGNLHYSQKFKTLYTIIGCLSSIKLLASLIKMAQDGSDIARDESPSIVSRQPTKVENTRISCSLCMEPRRHSTTTLCGHLFCWDCIHHWLNYKRECPVCRNHVEPSRLIKLYNF